MYEWNKNFLKKNKTKILERSSEDDCTHDELWMKETQEIKFSKKNYL